MQPRILQNNKETLAPRSQPESGEIWRPSSHLGRVNVWIIRTVSSGILRNLAHTSLDMIGRMMAFTNKVLTQ